MKAHTRRRRFLGLRVERFDSVILATGFKPDLQGLLPDTRGLHDDNGKPPATGQVTNEPGLYFCGHITTPTGQLRVITLEAKRISVLANGYNRKKPRQLRGRSSRASHTRS